MGGLGASVHGRRLFVARGVRRLRLHGAKSHRHDQRCQAGNQAHDAAGAGRKYARWARLDGPERERERVERVLESRKSWDKSRIEGQPESLNPILGLTGDAVDTAGSGWLAP
eukprot:3902161-Rhodomonas_salina.2